jgi:hypothetical protein
VGVNPLAVGGLSGNWDRRQAAGQNGGEGKVTDGALIGFVVIRLLAVRRYAGFLPTACTIWVNRVGTMRPVPGRVHQDQAQKNRQQPEV